MKKRFYQKLTNKTNTIVDTLKTSGAAASAIAIMTTEDVFSEAIEMASEWKEVASNAAKGGSQLASNQEDLLFDTLEETKSHLTIVYKRSAALFGIK